MNFRVCLFLGLFFTFMVSSLGRNINPKSGSSRVLERKPPTFVTNDYEPPSANHGGRVRTGPQPVRPPRKGSAIDEYDSSGSDHSGYKHIEPVSSIMDYSVFDPPPRRRPVPFPDLPPVSSIMDYEDPGPNPKHDRFAPPPPPTPHPSMFVNSIIMDYEDPKANPKHDPFHPPAGPSV
ncbi:hypothetical protein ACFE04_015847 [Oxalis oulophora]